MSVTAARGFLASGIAAGIKRDGSRDLALVRNIGPQRVAAGVFTANRFKAAPVIWSLDALTTGTLDAVVLNSGGANACTGAEGLADASAAAKAAATLMECDPSRIAVCSTGLIGVRLPMEAVLNGITRAAACLSVGGGSDAAAAIMTTDTVSKQAAATSPDGWCIGGMAKGAGMLAPALATMLVVLTTDAELTPSQADAALRAATRVTFDRIDSDGCMSTNDSVLLLANGAAGVRPDFEEFTVELTQVCASLARQLLRDAEGASHDIAINVVNAASEHEALDVARCVARSNLFKAAIFGHDPNWGRVLASAGTSTAAFDPQAVSVSFNGVLVFDRGGLGADRDQVDLTPREVAVEIDLAAGTESATVWTNDLTYDYVKENAEYSS